ncbi:STAS domain-containing protein [Methanospirillum hungatei]|uniref:STAS domain-containing protein n=1 Tax=Methanospirillum hungatei TaxID=2203 RepID=UPI0026F346C0|nr:STAS domain-containing protein [Methanospirillum hungatei]
MDISIQRSEGPLTLILSGRMDGFGAQQVAEAIRNDLRESDREIIFDLGGVDYISSAGLRVFQEVYRKIHERKGTVSLCQVGEFTQKVLKMGGFLQAFQIYPTLHEALTHSSTRPAGNAETNGIFTATHLTTGPVHLKVRGNISRVAAGEVMVQDFMKIPYEKGRYSVGIGAIGTDGSTISDLAGEMMDLSGSVIWVPADGNKTPDFITSDIIEAGDLIQSGLFQVSYDGSMHAVLTIENLIKPVSLQTLYEEIFRFAEKTWPSWGGICFVTFQAGIEGVCSSDITSSLVRAAEKKQSEGTRPEEHKSLYYIPRKDNLLDTVSVDVLDPQYRGETLLGCGYIVDIPKSREKFPEDLLKRITLLPTPSHPSQLYAHLCGAVMHDIPWNPESDMEARITDGLLKGSLLAMHRLLGVTMIRRATIAIAPVTDIIPVQGS